MYPPHDRPRSATGTSGPGIATTGAGFFAGALLLTLVGCSTPAPEPVPESEPRPREKQETRADQTTAPPPRPERELLMEMGRPAATDDAANVSNVSNATNATNATNAAIRRMHAPALVASFADQAYAEAAGETYPELDPSGVHAVTDDPVSTFSMDVDTAAYTNVRRLLQQGVTPPVEAVRIEEMLNYFRYDHPRPAPGQGFALRTEIAPSPAHPDRHLLMVGLTAEAPVTRTDRPRNLVLLVDTSGSMHAPDKLPLLQRALRLLVAQLDGDDRVALVSYAGQSGIVLDSTPGDQHARIGAAIDQLTAGGSTHGSAGLATAYALARQHFAEDGVNRVMLATDGDFNVGVSDPEALERLVDRQRASGIGLTVLGFGHGNYDDATAQALAQHGDGIAAYIDGLSEARRVLVDQLDAQLHTVARDARIQIEFNPARVAEYRLIGYETRAMAREDFEDDAVDAGDVGAGHQVTALYEIALVGSGGERVRPLRYDDAHRADVPFVDGQISDDLYGELAHVRIRWLAPRDGADQGSAQGGRIEHALRGEDVLPDLDQASDDLRFSAAVAGLGELLRGGRHAGHLDYAAVTELARSARGADPQGERGAFLGLVRLAEAQDVGRVARLD